MWIDDCLQLPIVDAIRVSTVEREEIAVRFSFRIERILRRCYADLREIPGISYQRNGIFDVLYVRRLHWRVWVPSTTNDHEMLFFMLVYEEQVGGNFGM